MDNVFSNEPQIKKRNPLKMILVFVVVVVAVVALSVLIGTLLLKESQVEVARRAGITLSDEERRELLIQTSAPLEAEGLDEENSEAVQEATTAPQTDSSLTVEERQTLINSLSAPTN